MLGTYNKDQRAKLPCQLGFEGSGTVVKSGGGFMSWLIDGRRVAAATMGKQSWLLWTEYAMCLSYRDAALVHTI